MPAVPINPRAPQGPVLSASSAQFLAQHLAPRARNPYLMSECMGIIIDFDMEDGNQSSIVCKWKSMEKKNAPVLTFEVQLFWWKGGP